MGLICTSQQKTVQFDEFVIADLHLIILLSRTVLPRSVYRSIECIRDKRQKQGRILGACRRQTNFLVYLKKGDNKVHSDTRTSLALIHEFRTPGHECKKSMMLEKEVSLRQIKLKSKISFLFLYFRVIINLVLSFW